MPLVKMPPADQATIDRRSHIIADLARIVNAGSVVSDEASIRAYESDALTVYRNVPLGVALPKSTAEVSQIMKYCSANRIKVVARGAGTSLCGGALPLQDALVLGLSKMNKILHVNMLDRTATVEAGVTNLSISAAVAHAKFFYAPDPSSQLACTIGGNVNTNAGGAHCLKYGVTLQHIMGLKVVLVNGDIVELGGDFLDAGGYDLLGLMIGSEGQFGIVTEVTVRILPQSEGARPLLIGFSTNELAGSCVSAIIASGLVPVAIEFMDKPAIAISENYAKAGYPLDVEALLIIEVDGSEEEIDQQLQRIVAIAQQFHPLTVRISQNAAEAAAIWKGRKAAFGAFGQISDSLCMDGVIPLSKLGPTLKTVDEIARKYQLKVANIFHAGDGNLHPVIFYDANNASEKLKAEECGADILKLCVDAGGCLSGEHGIGVEKRDLMSYQFSPADLIQQMRVKAAFDPQWLLNEGKVFPLDLQAHFKQEAAASHA